MFPIVTTRDPEPRRVWKRSDRTVRLENREIDGHEIWEIQAHSDRLTIISLLPRSTWIPNSRCLARSFISPVPRTSRFRLMARFYQTGSVTRKAPAKAF